MSLAAALEEMYAAFARYRPAAPPTHCRCCHAPDAGDLLLARPLREMTADDLEEFAGSALWTFGDVPDYKYFLPRLLELLAQGKLLTDAESLIGRLSQGDLRSWPAEEQQIVERCLMELWRATLRSEQRGIEADEVLCGIGRAVEDLRPFLAAWSSAPDAAACRHLIAFLDWNWESLQTTPPKLGNAYWGSEATEKQVLAWLGDPATWEAFSTAKALDAAEFEDALTQLGALALRL